MAGPKRWTETLIAERARAGRGQGIGEAYSPWLYVREFSSRGTQTRMPSIKMGRTVHLFSYLERALFLYAEFQAAFVAYREQYPMDRRVTLGAARTLGIRHPEYRETRAPVVMTIDALVTMRGADGTERVAAWDVKPARQLQDRRVQEKLSLHKAYCEHAGIRHFLFTEQSVSKGVIRNIDWIRMGLPRDGETASANGLFTWHVDNLVERLAAREKDESLSEFCAAYDRTEGLDRGCALRIAKLALWSHRIEMDLSAARIERESVSSIRIDGASRVGGGE